MSAHDVTITRWPSTQKFSQNWSTRVSVIASNTNPAMSEIEENGRSILAYHARARSRKDWREGDAIFILYYVSRRGKIAGREESFTMKIIFLVGRIDAGKSTVEGMMVEYFQSNQMQVERISFSDSLGAVLDIFDLPKHRDNYSSLAFALRPQFGPDIFRRCVRKRVSGLLPATDILIISGARFAEDIDFIPRHLSKVVAIEASEEVRYGRARRKSKDGEMTMAQFLRADCASTEGDIGPLMDGADYVISNNGDFDQLLRKVEAFVRFL
jgi:hypothetical protein